MDMDIKEVTQIAVLNNQVNNLGSDINEVKSDVKEVKTIMSGYADNFITRAEFQAFKKQYWLSHTLTAVLTATILGLIAYFINHHS